MKNTTKPGCCCFLIFLYSFMKPHWHNKHYCCILYWYITTLLYFVTWLERTICHSDAWMWLRSQLKHFSQKDNYLITFCSPAVWVGVLGNHRNNTRASFHLSYSLIILIGIWAQSWLQTYAGTPITSYMYIYIYIYTYI